jgi:hypothetical protein
MSIQKLSRLFAILALFSVVLAPLPAPAASHGRLVIKRSANFGQNLTLTIYVDGHMANRLQYGHVFSTSLSAGPHEIKALVTERRLDSSPTLRRVHIHAGKTTLLTAGFSGQDLVLQ